MAAPTLTRAITLPRRSRPKRHAEFSRNEGDTSGARLNDPLLPPGTDKCRCPSCGEYFRSSGTFALHRVGSWENRGSNRRCLTVAEMESRDWLKDELGYWIRKKRLHLPDFSRDEPRPAPEIGGNSLPASAAGGGGAPPHSGASVNVVPLEARPLLDPQVVLATVPYPRGGVIQIDVAGTVSLR